ncbi:hypothetical protein P0W64_16470 [Tsukamurella sp. 8F]|uniref:hypothetical protein n=1 Tax=unclassified Tsukamurella TaxID=2633480 RepID=UPI0023B98440|nr:MULTISPECIES: hypothetical protein [unclassified Tsukamurella]MDF0531130.1 hypothetical protein [Tsukamurella sp. 8J]MDF0588376.1 hypothetical protein [Tsukamurella sp. 8F]
MSGGSGSGSGTGSGPGGVSPAGVVGTGGAASAGGYYGAGPSASNPDLELAKSVVNALLVSTAEFYTEYAVGVFEHENGRHVVLVSTDGRSYLPPTARVPVSVSIARVDPLGPAGWDERFVGHSRPVETLNAYAEAVAPELKWRAVATSVSDDARPVGPVFAHVGRPAGRSAPEAVKGGRSRLAATWPDYARLVPAVADDRRQVAGLALADRIIAKTPTEVVESIDEAMVKGFIAGDLTDQQWLEFEHAAGMATMNAAVAGRSIGVGAPGVDRRLQQAYEAAFSLMILRETLLCVRPAGAPMLEDLVYLALQSGVDPGDVLADTGS